MTRAHVKLLGPCFKTDRMEQGTNATTKTTVGEFPHRGMDPTPRGVPWLPVFHLQSPDIPGAKRLAAIDHEGTKYN